MTAEQKAIAMSNLRCPSPPPILNTQPQLSLDEKLASTDDLQDSVTHPRQQSMHAHFQEPVRPRSRQGSMSDFTNQVRRLSVDNIVAGNHTSGDPSPGGSSVASPRIPEQNANIDPRLAQDDGKTHILLGVCGAFSTTKIKLIISKLIEIYGDRIAIQLILTESSKKFISTDSMAQLETKGIKVWRDDDEWTTWKTRSDPVLHIELRRWADILVVCPMTANTLSKIATGICDNLLTNVIRAWNTSFPILAAPAMISYSYNAVTTKRQLRLIKDEMPWIEVLRPVEKVIGAYGDIGMGGMMDWNEIVDRIVQKLGGYPEEDDEDDGDRERDDADRNATDDEGDTDDDDDDDDDETSQEPQS